MSHNKLKSSTVTPQRDSPYSSRKPLRVLLDVNLLLSVLADCEFPQKKQTMSLLSLVFAGEVIGYITETDFHKLELLSRRRMSDENAVALIEMLRRNFKICTITQDCIDNALESTINSFDMAIALSCAEKENIQAIIIESADLGSTQAFISDSKAQILSAEEFLRRYSFENQKLLDHGSVEDYYSERVSEPERLHPQDQEKLWEIFDGWFIKHFEVHVNAKDAARAKLSLWNKSEGRKVEGQDRGNGPVNALFRALHLAILQAKPSYELPESHVISRVQLESATYGSESPVNAEVTVGIGGETYTGTFVNTDSVKTVFYAYLDAIRKAEKAGKLEQWSEPEEVLSAEALRNRYDKGDRSFSTVTLLNLSLADAKLEGINLEKARIYRGDYRRITLSSFDNPAKLESISISHANLENANLSYANLCCARITDAKLSGANLFHAELDRVKIRSTELIKAQMHKVSLKSADLISSHLDGAVLDNADLTFANLSRANLNNANLNEANLTGTVFDEAKLGEVKLTNAILTLTNFSRAILVSADLRGAKLTETNFTDANLTNANLEGLDLTKADLTGSILDGANLLGARLTHDQVELLGGNLNHVNLNQAILINTSATSHSLESPEFCLGLS